MEYDYLIKALNKYFKNKVLKYQGPLIMNVDVNGDIDFKVEVIGTKKMISVGELRDYLNLKITIVGLNNPISKLLFGDEPNLDKDFQKELMKNENYFFKSKLIMYLRDIIRFFEDIRIWIDEIVLDLPQENNLTEQRMDRLAIRTIVRDITELIKNTTKSKEITLPKGQEEYQFINLPFYFKVELTLIVNKKLDKFRTESYYVGDEEVLELGIEFNPKNITKQLYELIGELNDIIAHELEHGMQTYYNEFNTTKNYSKEKNPYKYYTLPHEIPAQVEGLTRLAKLRKLPFEIVVKNWFNTHKDIHGLNEKQQTDVISKLIQHYNEKRGNV